MSTAIQRETYSPALVEELQKQANLLKQKARIAFRLNMLEPAIRWHAEAESIQISVDILRRCLRKMRTA